MTELQDAQRQLAEEKAKHYTKRIPFGKALLEYRIKFLENPVLEGNNQVEV